MAVVLLGLGSRGDVQPMAALAGALRRQGSDALVAALEDYRDLVEGEGAALLPLPGTLAEVLTTPGASVLSLSVVGQAVLLARWVSRLADPIAEVLVDAVQPGDTVVAGALGRGAGVALQQARGTKLATAVFTGHVPSLERDSYYFQHWLTGFGPYDRWGIRNNWSLSMRVGSALTRAVRRRLGLPRLGAAAEIARGDESPILVLASPVLVPPAADWPGTVHQTGWLAPQPREVPPDPGLRDFVAAGPVVYVGFGSVADLGGGRAARLVREASELTSVGIVTPGEGVRTGLVAPGLWAVPPLPHGWLFPQLAGVVHHGGAGTTQAALAAGVPQVAVPFGVDQPYHAWRLQRLGVGPVPVPIRRLTASRLAALVDDLTGPASVRYAARAKALAARLSVEDGIGRTIATMRTLGLLEGQAIEPTTDEE